MPTSIKFGQSTATDANVAAQDLYDMVFMPSIEFVLFFCSSHYDLEALTQAINRLFTGMTVIGCTTAGEIGPAGYVCHSLTGVSFNASEFKMVSTLFKDLVHLKTETCHHTIANLKTSLDAKLHGAKPNNRFALQLIDGLSNREEFVTYLMQRGLVEIPMIGGSAGDDQKFDATHIFYQGAFQQGAAVLMVIDTTCPIKIFKTQHFVDGNLPLVVTAADVATRTITELNGNPAAEEYANALGLEVSQLNQNVFAGSPVVVHLNGNEYVRSIQKVNPDGSLKFYCAIERGLILRIAHGVNLIENLNNTFNEIKASVKTPQLVIGFDCIFRRVEVEKGNLRFLAEAILKSNHTIGFSTYGEQFLGIHVNQTLTGIAIGRPDNE